MTLRSILAATAATFATATACGAFTASAYAQNTTAGVRGTVTDEGGAPLAGAVITLRDTRTGGVRTFEADANGAFSARSVAIGGPYEVTATAPGYRGETIEGLRLTLGSQAQVDFDLQTSVVADTTDTIVVQATRQNVQQVAIGPSSTFDLETITTLPSISRDIRDIIRLDPRLTVSGGDNEVTALGFNNRFNSFVIDGVESNDAFGLNASGTPARANFPIPFDAIAQTAVEFSPFDVTYGNFTGATVNIVTKSGTNDFTGSAFLVYNNRDLTGETIDGQNVLGEDGFDNYNWGATLGGPIIKDKLFFHFAYEEIDDGGEVVNAGPEGSGFADPIIGFSAEEATRIQTALSDLYGIDAGGLARIRPETSQRFLGRFDWLINDDHRLEFTLSSEEELEIEDDGGFSTDFSFANTQETSGSDNEFYSLRLFSQWTDNFSTELRASRRDNVDVQGPLGGGEAQSANPIPGFEVRVADDVLVRAGPGVFRSANELNTQTDQFRAKADYLLGNHTLTAGYELNQLDVFNLFAINATGTITFNSVDDLEAGLASSITGNGSFSGDINDAAASFSRDIHTLYVQDTWNPIDPLTLTLGLRYDFYDSSDSPRESQAFVDRYGFSNDRAFDGLDVFMPRFGVDYDAGETAFGETRFRGGLGIFSGGDPTVWFSNSFSNFGSGIGFGSASGGSCTDDDLQVLAGGSFGGIPDCVVAQQQAEAAEGQGRIDAVDPDFQIPSVFRASIGLTHFTDFKGAARGAFDDWRFDADLIVSDRRNAADFVDLTLTPNGEFLPDGRPVFNAVDPLLDGCDAVFIGPRAGFSGDDLANGGACDAGGDDQDILLTNVDGNSGGSTSISTQLSKTYDYQMFGRDASASINLGYAYTSAEDVNPNTSATATSNFEEVALAVINNPALANSPFLNRHVFSVATSFEQEFVPDLPTRLSVFFQAREGNPFSYAYDNNTPTNLFGDSDNEERNLIYVPTGPNDPLVQFADGFETDAFFNFLDESGLGEFAGEIAPRNAFFDPWVFDVDMRFSQALPTGTDKLRGLFYFDIENALNLLDDGLNLIETNDRGDVGEAVPVLDAALSDDGTQFVYSNFATQELVGNGSVQNLDPLDANLIDSVWAVQFGVRFEF